MEPLPGPEGRLLRFCQPGPHDLDVNFTIPGGFQFGLGAASDDAYRAMAQQRGWSSGLRRMDGAGGQGVLLPWRAHAPSRRLAAASATCQTIRRVFPEVKTLIYIHSFINTDPDGPRKHPDARITNADGTPLPEQDLHRDVRHAVLLRLPGAV